MDLQASFFQVSEPLISVDESAATGLPQHVNDSDFDTTTTHSIPEREGLTNTTFALVTYHAQRMGRVLNFAAYQGFREWWLLFLFFFCQGRLSVYLYLFV